MEFPKWQLHRGYWQAGLRENTMSAFKAAKDNGAEMIELDVQLSKGGIPHVFHDYSLQRFFHIDKAVSKVSSDDLSALAVPTLEEVLESPDVPNHINIEVKSIDLLCYGIAKKVSEVLLTNDGGKGLLISSFNPMVLFWVRRFLPETPRALAVGDLNSLMSWKFPCSVKLSKPDYINVHYKLIDEEVSRERLLSFEKPLMIWTVNDLSKADLYLGRGASSIISDQLPNPS